MASRESFGEAYERYGRSVFRRAVYLLGNEDAAKDATQEVFLRAMRAGDRGSFEASPMAWLYRVTTNLCLNKLRDRSRRSAILSAWKPAELVDSGAEAKVLVQRILAQVPEDLQDVAIYYYVDELSHEEIAEIIGVSRRTVGNRLASFHALARDLVTEAVS